MSPSQPTPSIPPVVPQSGNAKYIAVAVVLAIGIAALIAFKTCGGTPPPPPPIAMYDAAPTPHEDDLVPPPPPPEQPLPEGGGIKYVYVGDPCAVKSCNGSVPDELNTAIGFRAKQAHRCYDAALAQDQTLKGHVEIALRIASNGRVCRADITGNDMGTDSVARCVQSTFARTGSFPAPKGGCVDVKQPLNFIPGGK